MKRVNRIISIVLVVIIVSISITTCILVRNNIIKVSGEPETIPNEAYVATSAWTEEVWKINKETPQEGQSFAIVPPNLYINLSK